MPVRVLRIMITLKIDWLSLSAKVPLPLALNEFSAPDVDGFLTHAFSSIGLNRAASTSTRGRGAAHWGLSWLDGAIQLFAGDESGWIAIEFSGRGCQYLRTHAALDIWLNRADWRVTRVDVALDTDAAKPAEIAASVECTRFKTQSEVHSISGDTFYFGSPKSARMLRIYQYHKPHPRAGITRLEFVVRDKQARALVAAIAVNGLPSCAAELIRKFGVTSPTLSGVGDAKQLTGYVASERHRTGKYRWVLQQALPGLASAITDGFISRDAVIRRLDEILTGRVG